MTDRFEGMLAEVLAEKTAAEGRTVGLEERLLARVRASVEARVRESGPGAPVFGFAESARTRRSRASVGTALLAHAAVLLVVVGLTMRHVVSTRPEYVTKVEPLVVPAPPPPLVRTPRAIASGGGGGHRDLSPVTQGRLPKAAQEQIAPPKAPPLQEAKIALPPTVVLQKDVTMPTSELPNLGVPSSSLKGFSLGNGTGTGIGSGNGSGVGPGSGGNIGGGIFRVGGSVKAPVVLAAPDPEYSEEARKAKFSGNVQVYLVVDEQGRPTHVHAVRGIGMGLDEKAVEAVRQYRFRPATQNGKPVAVEMYVEVTFRIF